MGAQVWSRESCRGHTCGVRLASRLGQGDTVQRRRGWGHKVNELGDREKDGGCFWCLPWGLLEGEAAQRGRESRRRIYLGRQRTFLSCAGPG